MQNGCGDSGYCELLLSCPAGMWVLRGFPGAAGWAPPRAAFPAVLDNASTTAMFQIPLCWLAPGSHCAPLWSAELILLRKRQVSENQRAAGGAGQGHAPPSSFHAWWNWAAGKSWETLPTSARNPVVFGDPGCWYVTEKNLWACRMSWWARKHTSLNASQYAWIWNHHCYFYLIGR